MSWSYRFCRPLPDRFQFAALKRALKRKRFGVFFQQRVGKTRVGIDFCGVLNAKLNKQKFLVITPKSVLTIWPEAIEQYWNGPEYAASLLQIPETGAMPTFVIVNYDQIRLRWKEFKAWRPDVVLLDEVQYLKKHTSQRSKAVHKIVDITPYVMGMTGTPGKPEDGWFGIMRAIDQNVFGRAFTHYAAKYLNHTMSRGYFEMMGDPRNPDTLYFHRDELESKFMEASMRVLREDAGIVDQFEDINVPVDLEPKVKKLYRKFDTDSVIETTAGTLTAGLALTRDMRLHQLAGGFLTMDDGSVKRVSKAKYDKCMEIVKDLMDEDKQVVIICKFSPEVKALAAGLGEACRVIDGSVSNAARKEIRESFQAGKFNVLVAQQRAIAEGLDLTAAHNMIFFSVDFSLILYSQVRDRVMGRAQKHPVTYWHVFARGTVDKDVYRALQRGEDVVKALVNRRRTETWEEG